MASRGLAISMPIWVRVPGVVAIVLVGILLCTIVVGAAGIGGGAGPDKHPPGQRPNLEQQMGPGGRGGHQQPAGGH